MNTALNSATVGAIMVVFLVLVVTHQRSRALRSERPARRRDIAIAAVLVAAIVAPLALWPTVLHDSTILKVIGASIAVASSAWSVWSYRALGASFSVDAQLVGGHALGLKRPPGALFSIRVHRSARRAASRRSG